MIRRLAVISDVHGNRPALEAVLDDIRRRGIEQIVNLGDCLYGPLDPAGTADLLIRLDMTTVRGNEDRILTHLPEDSTGAMSLDFTRRSLSTAHISWLASLKPTSVAFDDFFLCHGRPDRDDQYLFYGVGPEGARVRSAADLEADTREITQRVILCGHDHTPNQVILPDGRLIVNPGSVGLQAYTDATPYYHCMQSGSPEARYAILTLTIGGWQVEHVAVIYDWQAAADLAKQNGREDWSRWLVTGCAQK